MQGWPEDADNRKVKVRITALLQDSAGGKTNSCRFTTGEPWTRSLQEYLGKLEADRGQSWKALMAHCATANTSKPTGKWLKQADTLIGWIGRDQFAAVIQAILAEIGKPGPTPKKSMMGYDFELDPTM